MIGICCKGDSVINVNNRIVDEAIPNMQKIEVDPTWVNLTYDERKD